MARKAQGRARPPRPRISLFPAPLISLGAIAGGLLMLGLSYTQYPRDGWYALVWVVPGLYVLAQPITGFVRGDADLLQVGLRKIDLTGLSKVTVHTRSQTGLKQGVASLSFPGRVEEISGLFLTTKGFTRLVEWFAVPITTIDGHWSMRTFRKEHPDLVPTRSRPRNQGAGETTKR